MRPYGFPDPLLTRAMRAYRREHRDDRAVDPIRTVPAPKPSQRQFACRLCGFHWLPYRSPMPRDLVADRASHRCWIPAEVVELRLRIGASGGAGDLVEVLRDRLEELTGERSWGWIPLPTSPGWADPSLSPMHEASPGAGEEPGR